MKFKNSSAILSIGLLLVLVVGFVCRYKLQPFGDQVLVINNFTGTKEIVSATGEVSVPYASGAFNGVELREVKTSNPLMNLKCKTKWRDGQLYYWVEVDMDTNKFEAYRNTLPKIIVVFLDNEGFTVLKQEIPLLKFVHHSGSPKGHWEGSYNSSTPMRLSDFNAITNWSPEWTTLQ